MLICWGSQIVQQTLIKENAPNSSVHLVTYNNSIITVYYFFRYTSVATNLTIAAFFEEGLSGIWSKKYFLFFKVNYLSSSK